MNVDRGAAVVEFRQDRGKVGMPEPAVAVAGHQSDPGRAKAVERVGDLGETGLDLRHRQQREKAEPAGVVAAHPGCEDVDRTRHFCVRRPVEETNCARGQR